tara:strand:+ start:2424 stop:2735 length:312 start_codon:yes stop_codon:yes gene_type:complete
MGNYIRDSEEQKKKVSLEDFLIGLNVGHRPCALRQIASYMQVEISLIGYGHEFTITGSEENILKTAKIIEKIYSMPAMIERYRENTWRLSKDTVNELIEEVEG